MIAHPLPLADWNRGLAQMHPMWQHVDSRAQGCLGFDDAKQQYSALTALPVAAASRVRISRNAYARASFEASSPASNAASRGGSASRHVRVRTPPPLHLQAPAAAESVAALRAAALRAAAAAEPGSFGVWEDACAEKLTPTARELSALPLESVPAALCPPVLIWRCRHAHGLFSMLSLALGHLEQCAASGQCLLVDWSWPGLLYAGPEGEPNLWNAFFRQPAELELGSESALLSALKNGRYTETETHEVVFGNYKGVIQGYGTIPPEGAARGRALCARWLVLRDHFRDLVERGISRLLGGGLRWLAVHVRRGDKGAEASANIELTESQIVNRIVAQCRVWRCDGVFLCTDDPVLKAHVSERVRGYGLRVSTYSALLSNRQGQGLHFDETLDKYQKAEDVMIEAMLMARGCHGLLSTYSNVSASVVYFSPDGYPYQTFWDVLPVLRTSPNGRTAPYPQLGMLQHQQQH